MICDCGEFGLFGVFLFLERDAGIGNCHQTQETRGSTVASVYFRPYGAFVKKPVVPRYQVYGGGPGGVTGLSNTVSR